MKRVLVGLSCFALFMGSLWTGWTFRANNSLSIDLDLIWMQFPAVELWWVVLVAISLGAGTTLVVVGFALVSPFTLPYVEASNYQAEVFRWFKNWL